MAKMACMQRNVWCNGLGSLLCWLVVCLIAGVVPTAHAQDFAGSFSFDSNTFNYQSSYYDGANYVDYFSDGSGDTASIVGSYSSATVSGATASGTFGGTFQDGTLSLSYSQYSNTPHFGLQSFFASNEFFYYSSTSMDSSGNPTDVFASMTGMASIDGTFGYASVSGSNYFGSFSGYCQNGNITITTQTQNNIPHFGVDGFVASAETFIYSSSSTDSSGNCIDLFLSATGQATLDGTYDSSILNGFDAEGNFSGYCQSGSVVLTSETPTQTSSYFGISSFATLGETFNYYNTIADAAGTVTDTYVSATGSATLSGSSPTEAALNGNTANGSFTGSLEGAYLQINVSVYNNPHYGVSSIYANNDTFYYSYTMVDGSGQPIDIFFSGSGSASLVGSYDYASLSGSNAYGQFSGFCAYGSVTVTSEVINTPYFGVQSFFANGEIFSYSYTTIDAYGNESDYFASPDGSAILYGASGIGTLSGWSSSGAVSGLYMGGALYVNNDARSSPASGIYDFGDPNNQGAAYIFQYGTDSYWNDNGIVRSNSTDVFVSSYSSSLVCSIILGPDDVHTVTGSLTGYLINGGLDLNAPTSGPQGNDPWSTVMPDGNSYTWQTGSAYYSFDSASNNLIETYSDFYSSGNGSFTISGTTGQMTSQPGIVAGQFPGYYINGEFYVNSLCWYPNCGDQSAYYFFDQTYSFDHGWVYYALDSNSQPVATCVDTYLNGNGDGGGFTVTYSGGDFTDASVGGWDVMFGSLSGSGYSGSFWLTFSGNNFSTNSPQSGVADHIQLFGNDYAFSGGTASYSLPDGMTLVESFQDMYSGPGGSFTISGQSQGPSTYIVGGLFNGYVQYGAWYFNGASPYPTAGDPNSFDVQGNQFVWDSGTTSYSLDDYGNVVVGTYSDTYIFNEQSITIAYNGQTNFWGAPISVVSGDYSGYYEYGGLCLDGEISGPMGSDSSNYSLYGLSFRWQSGSISYSIDENGLIILATLTDNYSDGRGGVFSIEHTGGDLYSGNYTGQAAWIGTFQGEVQGETLYPTDSIGSTTQTEPTFASSVLYVNSVEYDFQTGTLDGSANQSDVYQSQDGHTLTITGSLVLYNEGGPASVSLNSNGQLGTYTNRMFECQGGSVSELQVPALVSVGTSFFTEAQFVSSDDGSAQYAFIDPMDGGSALLTISGTPGQNLLNVSITWHSQEAASVGVFYPSGPVFVVDGCDLRASNADGTPVVPSTSPAMGAGPIMLVNGSAWQYLGSISGTKDLYGGAWPAELLWNDGSDLSLSDPSNGVPEATGPFVGLVTVLNCENGQGLSEQIDVISLGSSSFASVPASGPPALSVNGELYHFATSASGQDIYVANSGAWVTIATTLASDGSYATDLHSGVNDDIYGTFAGNVFMVSDGFDVRALNENGSFDVPATKPTDGVSAIAVNGELYYYQGTYTGNNGHTDEYVGTSVGDTILINSSGAVTGGSALGGSFGAQYSNGAFSNIASSGSTSPDIEAVKLASDGATSPQFGGSSTLYVNNAPWQFIGTSNDMDYYAGPGGPLSGELLTNSSSGEVQISDPIHGIATAVGHFQNGAFTGLPTTVLTASQQQQLVASADSSLTQTETTTQETTSLLNNLQDGSGNIISSGTTIKLGYPQGVPGSGLMIQYADQNSNTSSPTSVVTYTSGSGPVTWNFGAVGSSSLSLDGENKLTVGQQSPGSQSVVIDPQGQSTSLHVPPQGGIPMWPQ